MRILNEGTRLANRYTLIRQLGTGGMADVWLATDRQLEISVALKLLRHDFVGDAQQSALLQREWRVGSRLMHANIVRVFEYHDEADGAFYSLQFVGTSDISVLTGEPPSDCLPPLGLLADALRYAHQKHVFHRDIKASNILLDRRGLPYLTDFGVASDAGDAVRIDGGGSAVSSSPQQLAGEDGSAADDVFALGMLMHELLTGRPAVAGKIDANLNNGEPIPGALQTLLERMLHANAHQRPSAEGVVAALRDAGIAAGPAPTRLVSGEGVREESVQTVAPVKLKPRTKIAQPQDTGASTKTNTGIAPSYLYGGLGAAALLLLVVVFVLPNLSERPASATDSELATIAEEAVPVEETLENVSAQESAEEANSTDDPSSTAEIKAATDEALGDLLSQLERLRFRAIDRWGGQDYLDVVNVYAEGDQAYVDRNYRLAGEKYRQASQQLNPFFDRIDTEFEESLAAAKAAFELNDYADSIRLFDLATSITPGHREAEAGFARAKNLESVLELMGQGEQYEEDLELSAAKLSFEKALELDPQWVPARTALSRVRVAVKNLSFEQRMTEGFEALYLGDFDSAKAAFNAAKLLDPGSRQPADGLLQVDQEIRLAAIRRLEQEANALDADEQWEASVVTYEQILDIDADLQFAQMGLSNARARSALHARLAALIADPDTLSDQANIQKATGLLLEVARIEPQGPRLGDQKEELTRLLKRAATPLTVQLESDNMTNVAIFRVGQLGQFAAQEINLRPGLYVAVGSRAGYRDVRIEFRVAPEVEMKPIVVRCEEAI